MSEVIICETRPECRDQNVNRWYCAADRSGECPVKRCADVEIRRQP